MVLLAVVIMFHSYISFFQFHHVHGYCFTEVICPSGLVSMGLSVFVMQLIIWSINLYFDLVSFCTDLKKTWIRDWDGDYLIPGYMYLSRVRNLKYF